MTASDFDLFVIGGGSGGVRAARVAATYGARVAIAEADRYGGTCVIRGCVPKKLFVYASRFADDFEDAAGFGWTVGARTFDWGTLIANKDREISRLEGLYEGTLNGRGVKTFKARAVLDGAGAIKLDDGQRFTAKTILIATGGRPTRFHGIPGAEHVLVSDDIFDLKTLPERIVVLGGGYVALEFASVFAGLGVETTVVHRSSMVLRGFDDDLRDELMDAMGRRGVRFRLDCELKGIAPCEGGYRVTLSSGDEIETGQVLAAIGRDPATEGLGLETAGVTSGARGEILVDSQSQTTAAGIYAVGDVTNRANLTPVAIREGHAFADTVFGGKPTTVDYSVVPTAVFTTPELATVGLSEEDARARGHDVHLYKSRFRPMRNILAGREERTFMKLVVDETTDAVLGCHVLGPDAAEMVQMAAVALTMGATKADFDRTIALHPSAAEELVTMRERWMPPVT